MPTDEGDHERIAGVEGDGEREGFHFISLSFFGILHGCHLLSHHY